MIRRDYFRVLPIVLLSGCITSVGERDPVGFRRVIILNSITSDIETSTKITKGNTLIHEADYSIDAASDGSANSKEIKISQLGEPAYYETTVTVRTVDIERTVRFDSHTIAENESVACVDVYVFVEPGPEIGVAPRPLESCE